MKKNKMLRIASVMLVLALITTCVISGTFAKYVTTGASSDSARVAKWGVEVTATSNTAFGSIYKSADGTINTSYTAGTDSVKSNGDKVVAPGTNGSVAAVTITGTPEVKCQVTYAATIALEGWEVSGAEYCPIIFTVGGATYGTNDTNATNKSANVAALITAVQNAIAASGDVYEAGANLSTAAAKPSISWEWPFETGADADAKAANNVKDTALGDAAAAATISIDVVVTVAQVD